MANDRISQEPVEVIVSPTDGKARISQEPVEVIVSPTDGKARISQEPVEVIMRNLNESIFVTFID
jgi:ribosomal protein S27E